MYDHEAAQNVFAESSLWDRSKAYVSVFESCGRDHDKAQHKVASILGGSTKQRTAAWWKELAFDVHTEVREYYKTKAGKKLTQRMILDNKYMTGKVPGQGYRNQYKLNAKYDKLSIDQMAAKIEQGGKVPANEFINDFCLPNRRLQQYQTDTVNKFGAVASSFAAFHRVVDGLGTEGGRQKIMQCITAGKKFEDEAGIPECHALVVEMRKAKAGDTKAVKGASQAGGQSPTGQNEGDGAS